MHERSATLVRFLLVIASTIALTARGDQATVRITPPPWTPGGCTSTNSPSCGFASAEDPSRLIVNFLHDEVACLTFTDPAPPTAKVTSIDLRMSYAPESSGTQQFTVHVYGGPAGTSSPDSLVGMFVRSNVPTALKCAPPYEQLHMENVVGVPHADGIASYIHGGINSLVFSNTLDLEFIDIIVNFQPPPAVTFDLTSLADEKQRRVLIHRWRPDGSYFSDSQTALPDGMRDGRIRIAATVSDASGPAANQRIYLRVTDPADTAPYIPLASRQAGDNADGPGSLRDTVVTSDSNGRIETC